MVAPGIRVEERAHGAAAGSAMQHTLEQLVALQREFADSMDQINTTLPQLAKLEDGVLRLKRERGRIRYQRAYLRRCSSSRC